ncbi:MAG TPA: hypothetical protein PLE12_13040, partial [Propionicimonas sp.]|nr:hypothetical protein [Propionicimonas sp.]
MTGLTPEEVSAYADLLEQAEAGRSVPLVMAAPRRGRPPQHWVDLDPAGRAEAIEALGLARYRRDQLDRHVFGRLSVVPSEWTDIPAADRERLAEAVLPGLLERVRDQRADGGTTVKTLWRLHDASLVESVLMRYGVSGPRASGRGRERATVCISSQAGCGMACPF